MPQYLQTPLLQIFLLQIKQTKSKFAFGTAFNAPYVTDSSHTAYQQFIYDNFEWGVPENALKWKLMEWTKVLYVLIILRVHLKLCIYFSMDNHLLSPG